MAMTKNIPKPDTKVEIPEEFQIRVKELVNDIENKEQCLFISDMASKKMDEISKSSQEDSEDDVNIEDYNKVKESN